MKRNHLALGMNTRNGEEWRKQRKETRGKIDEARLQRDKE